MRIIKIKGCKTCKEVLIYIMRNENGEDFLQLVAWHTTDDGMLIQTEQIDLTKNNQPYEMLRIIMNDFSEFAANQFANSMAF